MRHALLTLYTIAETVRTLVLFPLWWYTHGLHQKAQWAWRELHDCRRIFHVSILIRHLLSPLYGYDDWETKFVSMIVRPGHLLCHLVITGAFVILYLGSFILWVIAPALAAYNIAYQLKLVETNLYEPFTAVLETLAII